MCMTLEQPSQQLTAGRRIDQDCSINSLENITSGTNSIKVQFADWIMKIYETGNYRI
jgi:hypothetical protein